MKQCLGNQNHLHLASAERGHTVPTSEFAAQPFQDNIRLFVHGIVVHKKSPGHLVAKGYILPYRQLSHKVYFLMHLGNAEFDGIIGIFKAHFSPVNLHISIVIRIDLPAPFSPRRACISPLSTVKSTLSSALLPGNCFVILEKCIIVAIFYPLFEISARGLTLWLMIVSLLPFVYFAYTGSVQPMISSAGLSTFSESMRA